MFQISTLNFVKNEILTHTANSGKGSAFFEDPGSGLRVLYKE